MRRVAFTLLAALAATTVYAADASARPGWRGGGYYGARVARPWVAPRARFGYARPRARRAAWRRGYYGWRRPWARSWGYGAAAIAAGAFYSAAVATPYYGWGYGYGYPIYYGGYAAPYDGGAVYVSSGLRAYAYPTYVYPSYYTYPTYSYATSGAGCGYWAYGCGWSYSYPAYALPTNRPYYSYGSYGYGNVGYGFGGRGYGCGTCAVSYSWRPCGCW